ncbi:GIY-YIG nuclease family protein [Patescibacteria group bacterium]|nr:GIY-YIG nuclease family protein [Patescibacteria group bacterium]
MKRKTYYIYIMASPSGTLYTGVTNNLFRRVWEHKMKLMDGFTKKYNCTRLVYYEEFKNINEAIRREKQIKNWGRKKKEFLIKTKNQHWSDLLEEPNIGR